VVGVRIFVPKRADVARNVGGGSANSARKLVRLTQPVGRAACEFVAGGILIPASVASVAFVVAILVVGSERHVLTRVANRLWLARLLQVSTFVHVQSVRTAAAFAILGAAATVISAQEHAR